MNRLQKKCVIATAGFHLLLLVILLVGPAFFNARQKPDDSQVLDVIPANLIDAQFNSGVKNAQPPAPTPVSIPQPEPPAPKPTPTFAQRVEKFFTPEPVKPSPDLTPVEKPEKSQPHKIQVNTQLVTRNASQNSTDDSQRAQVLKAIRNLKKNLSPSTTINLPGNSSAATANYASVVKSVYDAAWTLPDTIAKDENVTVSVTIASDGTVISSHIVTPSGDASADNSVQRTLDRVQFVEAFPPSITGKQLTFTIIFNPQVKQSE